jgi:hypothetical protein
MQVQVRFQITQHSRDAELMKSLVGYLNCGHYQLMANRDASYYDVARLSDIVSKVIPFFNKYPIIGVKALDFSD